MASTSKESYGFASYALSRHRKNKVFMWQSRVQRGRVYEFLLASKFKVPGLVSWKCMHCMQIREQRKKLKLSVKNLKIPLVLIDNDVIRENPDRPLNAMHFCRGKDVVDAVLKRTKLQFYDEWSAVDEPVEVSIDHFSDTVLNAVPLDLDVHQKNKMKQSLDEKCEKVMRRVLRKRRQEVLNNDPSGLLAVENGNEVWIDYDQGNQLYSYYDNGNELYRYYDQINELYSYQGNELSSDYCYDSSDYNQWPYVVVDVDSYGQEVFVDST